MEEKKREPIETEKKEKILEVWKKEDWDSNAPSKKRKEDLAKDLEITYEKLKNFIRNYKAKKKKDSEKQQERQRETPKKPPEGLPPLKKTKTYAFKKLVDKKIENGKVFYCVDLGEKSIWKEETYLLKKYPKIEPHITLFNETLDKQSSQDLKDSKMERSNNSNSITEELEISNLTKNLKDTNITESEKSQPILENKKQSTQIELPMNIPLIDKSPKILNQNDRQVELKDLENKTNKFDDSKGVHIIEKPKGNQEKKVMDEFENISILKEYYKQNPDLKDEAKIKEISERVGKPIQEVINWFEKEKIIQEKIKNISSPDEKRKNQETQNKKKEDIQNDVNDQEELTKDELEILESGIFHRLVKFVVNQLGGDKTPEKMIQNYKNFFINSKRLQNPENETINVNETIVEKPQEEQLLNINKKDEKEKPKNIKIPIINDDLDEPNETSKKIDKKIELNIKKVDLNQKEKLKLTEPKKIEKIQEKIEKKVEKHQNTIVLFDYFTNVYFNIPEELILETNYKNNKNVSLCGSYFHLNCKDGEKCTKVHVKHSFWKNPENWVLYKNQNKTKNPKKCPDDKIAVHRIDKSFFEATDKEIYNFYYKLPVKKFVASKEIIWIEFESYEIAEYTARALTGELLGKKIFKRHSDIVDKDMSKRNSEIFDTDEGKIIQLMDSITNICYDVPTNYLMYPDQNLKKEFCNKNIRDSCSYKDKCKWYHVKREFWSDCEKFINQGKSKEKKILSNQVVLHKINKQVSKQEVIQLYGIFNPIPIIKEDENTFYIIFESYTKAENATRVLNGQMIQNRKINLKVEILDKDIIQNTIKKYETENEKYEKQEYTIETQQKNKESNKRMVQMKEKRKVELEKEELEILKDIEEEFSIFEQVRRLRNENEKEKEKKLEIFQQIEKEKQKIKDTKKIVKQNKFKGTNTHQIPIYQPYLENQPQVLEKPLQISVVKQKKKFTKKKERIFPTLPNIESNKPNEEIQNSVIDHINSNETIFPIVPNIENIKTDEKIQTNPIIESKKDEKKASTFGDESSDDDYGFNLSNSKDEAFCIHESNFTINLFNFKNKSLGILLFEQDPILKDLNPHHIIPDFLKDDLKNMKEITLTSIKYFREFSFSKLKNWYVVTISQSYFKGKVNDFDLSIDFLKKNQGIFFASWKNIDFYFILKDQLKYVNDLKEIPYLGVNNTFLCFLDIK